MTEHVGTCTGMKLGGLILIYRAVTEILSQGVMSLEESKGQRCGKCNALRLYLKIKCEINFQSEQYS